MNSIWYVVWSENHGAPTVKHFSKTDAVNEAKRLARHHPGSSFHVLEWIGTAMKQDVVFTDVNGNEIPF